MPKKDGISKTYSFNRETVRKIEELCNVHKRTATNLLEKLIDEEYKEYEYGKDRQTKKEF